MAITTTFPTTLDSFPTIATGETIEETASVSFFNYPRSAIEALEVKVGVDSSAVTTSLDYLVKNASSVDPGHLHSTSGISGQIAVAQGGTGLSTVAANSLIYASATDTIAALAPGTDGYFLKSASGVPTWTAGDFLDTTSIGSITVSSASPILTLTQQGAGDMISMSSTATNTPSLTVGNDGAFTLDTFLNGTVFDIQKNTSTLFNVNDAGNVYALTGKFSFASGTFHTMIGGGKAPGDFKGVGLGTSFATADAGEIVTASNHDILIAPHGTGTLVLGATSTSETTNVIDVAIEMKLRGTDYVGTMGDSSKDPTTDAPADWIETQIGGTTYYVPVYAAS